MRIRIFSALAVAFLAISSNAACPSKRVLLQQVKKERAELEDKNSKLKLLLQGNWTGPDAADLFITALGSEDDQRLRVAELSKSLKVIPYRPVGYSELFSCLDKFGMQDIADEFSSLALSLDQARLIFLRLPTQVQEVLIDPSKQVGNAYDDVRAIQDRIAAVEETLPPLAEQELSLLTEMLKRAKDDLLATSELKGLTQEVRSKKAENDAFARANALWRHLVDDTFYTFRAPEMVFPEEHEHPGREESLKKEHEVVVTSRFVYLEKPVAIVVEEVEFAYSPALKFIVKSYVLDVRYEKALQTDIVTRVSEVFRSEKVVRPTREVV